jgi:hypothetical protein
MRDPVEARNEDAAEIDETLLQRVPGLAVLRPFGVEPPDTRVAVSCLIGEFAGQGGFADAAEAVNRRRLSDRSRIARSECVPDLAQLVGAAREARRRLDLRAQIRARRAPIGCRGRCIVLVPARFDRGQHDLAHPSCRSRIGTRSQ